MIGKTRWIAPHKDIVNIITKSSSYTMGTASTDELCLVTGTTTITLPTAVGCTGKVYVVKRIGTGTVTIDCTGGQTIDGAATASLTTQYSCIAVVSNGANWLVL